MIETHDLEEENKSTSESLDTQAQLVCCLPFTCLLEINHQTYEDKQSVCACVGKRETL